MIQAQQWIRPRHVQIDEHSKSKTAVLMKISMLLADKHPALDANTLFDQYWKRETLGSTDIGEGIAIPHARSADVETPAACFLRLLNPVDFGADDKRPADLIIGLLVPDNKPDLHLYLLQTIVTQFKNQDFCEACRKASDNHELYLTLLNQFTQKAKPLMHSVYF